MFQVTFPVTLKLSLENKLISFFCKFQKIKILCFSIFFSFCILHSFKIIKSNLSSIKKNERIGSDSLIEGVKMQLKTSKTIQ